MAASVLVSLQILAASLGQTEIVWENAPNSTMMTVESSLRAAPPADTEAADDFDVVGVIERVEIGGYQCFPCAPSDVLGIDLRFHAWTAAGPGALLSEQRVAAGDPRLRFDVLEPAVIEVTLPSPFIATGRHFVSAQLETGSSGAWSWWVSNWRSPSLSALWHRDAARVAGWAPYKDGFGVDVSADLALKLWGRDGTPPVPGSDPCGTWREEPTPAPSLARHLVLRDLAAIAPDDVWAVGEVQVPGSTGGAITLTHTTHWDGTRWSIVPSPSPTWYADGTWCDLQAVAADGAGAVWAAGTQKIRASDGFIGNQVLVLRWDGSAWSVVPAPLTPPGGSGANARDIAVIAPDDVWFAGEWVDASPGAERQPGLAMRWNGSGFELHNTPMLDGGGTGIEALSALAPDDIWAVGGGGDGDWTATSTILHWDGAAWEHRPGPTPGFFQRLFDVEAIAPDDVWAVGEFQDGAGLHALVLHWDGAGWTQVAGEAGSMSLHAFGPADVYSAGGGIHHWDGTSWRRVESFPGVNEPSEAAIHASGPCELWTAGRKVTTGLILPFTARIGRTIALDLLRDASIGALDRASLDLAGRLPLLAPEDLYLPQVATGALDPEAVILAPDRPLILYALDSPTAVLHMTRAGDSVRFEF